MERLVDEDVPCEPFVLPDELPETAPADEVDVAADGDPGVGGPALALHQVVGVDESERAEIGRSRPAGDQEPGGEERAGARVGEEGPQRCAGRALESHGRALDRPLDELAEPRIDERDRSVLGQSGRGRSELERGEEGCQYDGSGDRPGTGQGARAQARLECPLEVLPMGRIRSLNVSGGGVPKRPVSEAYVTKNGLRGDVQGNLRCHGGPERAVSLFSFDVLERLREEGHPIAPGSTGENVTIAGVDWALVAPGARLEFEGGVVLEVASYCVPCGKIRASFSDGKIHRVNQEDHPGESRVYARVLAEGTVRTGSAVRLVRNL